MSTTAHGKIAMACMTPAAEGIRLSINDAEARAFRAGIIEFLMLPHPHDCPVCDEGGECHLQDMTVMTGHTYRRTRLPKRTHRNQNLGPLVAHEMNRCIACYRCVRFYRDLAGGRDLDVMGWHDHVYFGRQQDGKLESEFSGNLVEVCPTGVFTDKTQATHFTRKWDLQTAPSVCVHCGVGCNTLPGERYGKLRRVRARFNAAVNGYFLCDRGRYGYEFVNDCRLNGNHQEHEDHQEHQEQQRGLDSRRQGQPSYVNDKLGEDVLASIRAGRAVGVGSPRASLESNFALRELVGAERFCGGMATRQWRLMRRIVEILGGGNDEGRGAWGEARNGGDDFGLNGSNRNDKGAGETRTGELPATRGGVAAASLADIARAEGVLVLGEDLTNVAPMMDFAVRQSLRALPARHARERFKLAAWEDAAIRNAVGQERGPVFIATPGPVKLDAAARASLRLASDDLVRLAEAIAAEINLPVHGDSNNNDKSNGNHEGHKGHEERQEKSNSNDNGADTRMGDGGAAADNAVGRTARDIAAGLLSARSVVVISGCSSGSEELLDAAVRVADGAGQFAESNRAWRSPRRNATAWARPCSAARLLRGPAARWSWAWPTR